MPKVTYLLPDGSARTLAIAAGTSAMMAAIDAHIPGIEAACLGDCVCATCHVYVAPEWVGRLPPPREEELETLENAVGGTRDGSRLSCQLVLTEALDGLTLTIPETQ